MLILGAMATTSTPRPLWTHRLVARAIAVLVAVIAPACADASFGFDGSAPEAAGDCAPGTCAAVCPVDQIALDEDTGTTCAQCTLDGAAQSVCGFEQYARCENHEFAATCSICALEGGEYLYEDCFAPVQVGGSCFRATDVNRPELSCEACFGQDGRLTSQVCAPPADHEERSTDGACTVFFDGTREVYRVCARPQIEPEHCVVYGGEQGRCVDCYGHAGELVSHECSMLDEASRQGGVRCEQKVVGGDSICEICSDARGVFISETCDSKPSVYETCRSLDLPGESCTACVDDVGRLRRFTCQASTCTNSASCIDESTCILQVGGGDVCRTCSTFAGEAQTACIGGPSYTCSAEDVPVAGADDGSMQTCTICQDENGYAFWDSCSGEPNAGAPSPAPPSECTQTENGCKICDDPQTGQPITICDETTCRAANEQLTVADDGQGGTVDAFCQECGDATFVQADSQYPYETYQRCYLDEPCAASAQRAEYEGACPSLVSYGKTIAACGTNTWDVDDAGYASTDDVIVRVMAWGLANSVSIYVGAVGGASADGTACPYVGADLRVQIAPEDAAFLEGKGFVATVPIGSAH